jgi:hypothetical protein
VIVLDRMKPSVGDSRTRSRGKGTEGAADSKASRLGSVLNDSTRYERGEANPVANPGAKNTGGLDRGERKPPAPKWCLQGLSKTQQRRLQKLRQMEIAEKLREKERDRWFNKA